MMHYTCRRRAKIKCGLSFSTSRDILVLFVCAQRGMFTRCPAPPPTKYQQAHDYARMFGCVNSINYAASAAWLHATSGLIEYYVIITKRICPFRLIALTACK